MYTSKKLAMAYTSVVYSDLLLRRIENKVSKASPADVSAGIISAAGMLKSAFGPGVNDPLEKKFLAISKSLSPIAKELKEAKALPPLRAAHLQARVSKIITRINSLWEDVENGVCK